MKTNAKLLMIIELSRKVLATLKSRHSRMILLLPAPRPGGEGKETAIVTVTVIENDAARNHSATADFAILHIPSSTTQN